MLKKVAMPIFAAAVTLTTIGVASVTEMTEYGRVVAKDAAKVVRESIPTSTELARLDLMIDDLEDRTAEQRRVVATAEVDLEDAKAGLDEAKQACRKVKTKLTALRAAAKESGERTLVSTCGDTTAVSSSCPDRETLTRWLNRYRVHADTLAARTKQVEAQQAGVDRLRTQLIRWESDRDELRSRADSLRARHEAAQAAVALKSPTAGDTLGRAEELAERLDRRLRIEERVSSDGLSTDLLTTRNETEPSTVFSDTVNRGTLDLISEIDSVLSTN